MEGYYQETGRADVMVYQQMLSYGLGDVITMRHMLDRCEADEQHKRLERRKLDALLGFCERHFVVATYYSIILEKYPTTCNNCDNRLEPVETWDGKIAAQMAMSCVYRTGQRFGVKHSLMYC